MSNEALSNLLHEERSFPPSEDFASAAVAKADLYDRAGTDRPAATSSVPPSCSTCSAPSRMRVHSSNSGRWPGSVHPSGDTMRATLTLA